VEKQLMFELCHDGNHFVTQDLTDDTPSDEYDFVPRQIFEGDKYITWFYEHFQVWTCHDCGEMQWADVMSGKWEEEGSSYCDFVNGKGAIDCQGCGRCDPIRDRDQAKFWYWPFHPFAYSFPS